MILRRHLLLVLVLIAGWLRAAEGLPAPLTEVQALLRVNDPRWLERELMRLTAAASLDTGPARQAYARLLYHAQSLDGFDLTRPALLAWRSGVAPLLAIIPLTDRRAFIQSFGSGLGDEAPLIRVGERDGTVVYTQNRNEGLAEYRLLVIDNTAFLAATPAECRALAERPLSLVASAAPLSLQLQGDYLAASTAVPELNLPLLGNTGEYARRAYQSLAAQVESVTIELRPDGEDSLRVQAKLQARSETALAVWIGNQKNQPSRLLPLLRTPNSVLSLAGTVAWQGQGERLGQLFGEVAKQRAGARWTPVVEDAWQSLWSILDRSGAFAWACTLSAKDGRLLFADSSVIEQLRSAELLPLANTVRQALDAGSVASAVAVGNASGYRFTTTVPNQAPLETVSLATERYLVENRSQLRDPALDAGEVLQRLQTLGAADSNVGIFQANLATGPLLRVFAQALRGTPSNGPSADLAFFLKTAGPGELLGELLVPSLKFAQQIRDSGLLLPEETKKR